MASTFLAAADVNATTGELFVYGSIDLALVSYLRTGAGVLVPFYRSGGKLFASNPAHFGLVVQLYNESGPTPLPQDPTTADELPLAPYDDLLTPRPTPTADPTLPSPIVIDGVEYVKAYPTLSSDSSTPFPAAAYHVLWAYLAAAMLLEERSGDANKVALYRKRADDLAERMRKRYITSRKRDAFTFREGRFHL